MARPLLEDRSQRQNPKAPKPKGNSRSRVYVTGQARVVESETKLTNSRGNSRNMIQVTGQIRVLESETELSKLCGISHQHPETEPSRVRSQRDKSTGPKEDNHNRPSKMLTSLQCTAACGTREGGCCPQQSIRRL